MSTKTPPTLDQLRAENRSLFETCEVRSREVGAIINRLVASQARYEDAVLGTPNVPWFFVAILHQMEAGGDFSKHLHNGDSLRGRTVNVPAGRPRNGQAPFTFKESALDAIWLKGFHKQREWTIETMLYRFEAWNGWGYRLYHTPCRSPFLWAGSQHYTAGKYIADGVWSDTAVSKQTGAAVLLKDLWMQGLIEISKA